jgi:hypothetical protein
MAYCGPRGIPLSDFLSWSDDDQDAALGWQSDDNARCRSCGTHPDEWRVGGRRAFHAHARRCPGCEQLEQVRAAAPLDGEGVHHHLARGTAKGCPVCDLPPADPHPATAPVPA